MKNRNWLTNKKKGRNSKGISAFLFLLVGFAVIGFFGSCDKRENCTLSGNARCNKQILQICAGDKKWTDNVDCKKTSQEIGVKMICGYNKIRKRNSCVIRK